MKSCSYKLYFKENEDNFEPNHEYWDSGLGAAGCIFIAKSTGRILLAHRNPDGDEEHGTVMEPDTWATWGGKIDDGESPKDAVVREVEEETGYDGEYKLSFLWTFEDPEVEFKYHNYLAIVQDEFLPKRTWENDGGKWVEWGHWPRPMHFGLEALLKHAGNKIHKVVMLIKHKQADVLTEVITALPHTPPAIVQKAAPRNAPSNNLINSYIVAATIWREGQGEGVKGMQAIMNVIMNRAGSFDRASKVVLKPKQFSTWNNVTNPVETALSVAKLNREDKDPTWLDAIRIVDQAARGKLSDITGGALFYFNPDAVNPAWSKRLSKTATIGSHEFYKIKPKVKKKVPSAITEMIQRQNPHDTVIFKKGIVGDGLFEYEMRSPFSFIRYKFSPARKLFYFDMIGTPREEDQGQGHASAILETFFQLMKQYRGTLDCDTYTTSGMSKIKPAIEKMAKQFGIRIVKGEEDGVDNIDESAKLLEVNGNIKKKLLMESRATPKQLVEFLRAQIKGTEWDGKVFAVGGFVRDLLMGKEPKDLDVVIGVDQGGLLFTKWLGQKLGIYKEGSNPIVYPTFGTANLRLEGVIWNGIDFSTENIDAVMFRKEQYHDPNSRKPVVQFTPDIAVDAQRRDITFNALYLDIASGEILDPTGRGKEDLKSGVIRTAIDPSIIYTDDALRMFRAVRFAAKMNFKLSPEVVDGIKKNLDRLNNTSKERVRDELNKILVSDHPDYGLKLLRDTGLLSPMGAEFQQMVGMTQNAYHKDDVFDHTLAVIMGTQPELLRRLIALFHDIGKVATRSVTPTGVHFYGHEEAGPEIVENIMMALKYPRTLIDAVKLGVRHHMKLKQGGNDAVKLSDSTLRRFKIALGEYLEQALDVMHADNICHADASNMPNQIEAVRQRLSKLDIKVSKPNLPITGNDLLALGFKPGPSIGMALKAVTDKWYENPQISKDDALAIAKTML